MKIVIPGGTGQIGHVLVRELTARGDDVVVISRSKPEGARWVRWDGKKIGDWAKEIDGADVVINLAGRSVNCRYTAENLAEMMSSRIDSTRIVGQAIAQAERPPKVWLQMSTATIYAHRFDAANDEETGILGGSEPDVPRYWDYSIEIATKWEAELAAADTPHTRKVALRSAVVMSPDRGGPFSILFGLARSGLGGPVGGGGQYMSWIHERDFVRAIDFIVANDDIEGAINLAAPSPLPQRDAMVALRRAAKMPIGLPATKWMASIGAFFMRSDPELVLKSRRVVPKRLLDRGFVFEHPEWAAAARELASRV